MLGECEAHYSVSGMITSGCFRIQCVSCSYRSRLKPLCLRLFFSSFSEHLHFTVKWISDLSHICGSDIWHLFSASRHNECGRIFMKGFLSFKNVNHSIMSGMVIGGVMDERILLLLMIYSLSEWSLQCTSSHAPGPCARGFQACMSLFMGWIGLMEFSRWTF